MNIARYHSGPRPSKFERHARTAGIVAAILFLGLTIVEVATTVKRNGSVQKLTVPASSVRLP
jgi:hypothetical protein